MAINPAINSAQRRAGLSGLGALSEVMVIMLSLDDSALK
jgi:hypothetical protein